MDLTFFNTSKMHLHATAKSLQSCLTSVQPHRRQPTRLARPWDSPGKNTGVGCHFLFQCRKVKSESEVAQSCLTPSDPMDCSSPGSRQEYWSWVPLPSPHLHEELLSQNIYSMQTGQENFHVTRQDKRKKKREIRRALEPVGGSCEKVSTHWEVLSEVRRSSGTERELQSLRVQCKNQSAEAKAE